jgi:hypothetical protein
MSDTYNGWTNYATWRINLEIFDGVEPGDLGCFTRYEEPELSDVAEYLNEHVDEILCSYAKGGPCGEGLTLDYARAFVAQVNWHEIAQHFMDEWKEQTDEEERERDEEERS